MFEKMMFESVQWYEWFSKISEGLLGSMFDVRSMFEKNAVWVCLMNDLVKAFWVWCTMSVDWSQNSGVRVWSSIDEHVQVCLMFEFVRCSIK